MICHAWSRVALLSKFLAMDWTKWLSETELEPSLVAHYASLFSSNQLDQEDIPILDHELLSSIGIHIAKHRIFVLQQKKRVTAKPLSSAKVSSNLQSEIIEHLKKSELNESKLLDWVTEKWPLCKREKLVAKGYLHQDAPAQGLSIITPAFRTDIGENMLFDSKAVLWAVLFAGSDNNVKFDRTERELLSLTVPVKKAHIFNFFEAVTEIGASGTWRDPDNVSNDEDAPNMVLQVEYGELVSELIGDAIMVCTHLINLLEVNEETLYARCANVQQSTLMTELYFEKKSKTLVKH